MSQPDPRDPMPPPFPIGTRLRCVDGVDAYASRTLSAREIRDHPEDWIRISGRGIEVMIEEVWPGRRGTGIQFHDEDGPMRHDDGEPMIDQTRDGYSVYRVSRGDGHPARQIARCIRPDDARRWEILPAPLRVRAGDFLSEGSATVPPRSPGLVLSSGPKTFDVIWIGGSTTRYRHGVRDVRIVGSAQIDALSREHLLRESEAARRERRSGAGVRRGQVAPSR